MPEENLNNLSLETAEPPPLAAEATVVETPVGFVDNPPDPASMKAEIEALEAKRKKAEEDAIYWRKQKAEARAEFFRKDDRVPQERTSPPPPVDAGLGPEPKPADFQDYDQYVGALTDYRVKKARSEWELDISRREREKAQQERAENLRSKLQEGYTKYPDFEEVTFDRSAIHITPMIVDILAEVDNPADVAYYLAKNRIEGVAISRMTPTQAARAIARIEAKLATEPPPSTTSASSKKPTTAAPPPINPLSGGSGGISKDPDKMTQQEFEMWRAKQGARRF